MSLSSRLQLWLKKTRLEKEEDWDGFHIKIESLVEALEIEKCFKLADRTILDETDPKGWDPQEILDLDEDKYKELMVTKPEGQDEKQGYTAEDRKERKQVYSALKFSLGDEFLLLIQTGIKDTVWLWARLRFEFDGPRVLRLVRLNKTLYTQRLEDFDGFSKYAVSVQKICKSMRCSSIFHL